MNDKDKAAPVGEREAFEAFWKAGFVTDTTKDLALLAYQAGAAYQRAQQPQSAEAVDMGSEWTPCVKLPVVVHVRQQRDGESHVSTREGITPIKPDDLIMRGVAGEEYPIGRELFERTYTFDTTPQPSAGVVMPELVKDATEFGNSLNEAGWVFLENCPEKSGLLFNNCKQPLRLAILKYLELEFARLNGKEVGRG